MDVIKIFKFQLRLRKIIKFNKKIWWIIVMFFIVFSLLHLLKLNEDFINIPLEFGVLGLVVPLILLLIEIIYSVVIKICFKRIYYSFVGKQEILLDYETLDIDDIKVGQIGTRKSINFANEIKVRLFGKGDFWLPISAISDKRNLDIYIYGYMPVKKGERVKVISIFRLYDEFVYLIKNDDSRYGIVPINIINSQFD